MKTKCAASADKNTSSCPAVDTRRNGKSQLRIKTGIRAGWAPIAPAKVTVPEVKL